MIEARNLLSEDKVLQQSRPPLTGFQAVLVRDRSADVRCQEALTVVYVVLGDVVAGRDAVSPGSKSCRVREGTLGTSETSTNQRGGEKSRTLHFGI